MHSYDLGDLAIAIYLCAFGCQANFELSHVLEISDDGLRTA